MSSAKSASQLHLSPGSHVTVSLCFLRPPSPRHLTRSHRLMRTMCISRESNPGHIDGNDDLIHIGSRSPAPFSSSLHDTTFSRSTPHFLALFQPPVRNPQETQGNPHSCSGNPEVTPLKMPSHTLCALTRLSPCIARFVFGRRRLDVRLHSIGRRQHTTLEHTFRGKIA